MRFRSILGELFGLALGIELAGGVAAESSIILSSLPTAMNCQPSRARARASSAVRTCRPHGSRLRRAASRMRPSVASKSSLFGGEPSGPRIENARSLGPDEHGVETGHRVDLVGDLDGLDSARSG